MPTGVSLPPATVTVEVSGTETYGSSSPTFSFTDNAPNGVEVGGTLNCSTVDGGHPIATTVTAGDYTLDGSNCSGLSLSGTGASGYGLSYAGVANGFVINPAPLTVTASTRRRPTGERYRP